MNKEYKKYRNEVLKCIETKEIRDRMEYLLNWYSRKATQCKRRYYIFAAIGIIGPALVTVISNCTYLSDFCLVPVISTCSSIGTAILALTRWQEGWIRYRRTVEHIKTFDAARTSGIRSGTQRGERYHGIVCTPYKKQVDILLMFPVGCFCLNIYTVDAVKHIEIVYIYRTCISFHSREYIG